MRILVVDDEEGARQALRDLLARRGFDVETVPDGEAALALLAERPFHVMITDLRMPGIDGLELVRRAQERHPALFSILLTAYGTVEHAVEALKAGLYHYLQKPVNMTELLATLAKIREVFDLRAEVERFQAKLSPRAALGEFIGQDPLMAAVYRQIERAAILDCPVLISGETGTGKELAARTIHALSPRKGEPFTECHCAAFSETLIESELFGHVRGAFTGAAQERAGRIRTAHKGTLFLDEIASMSINTQSKLLRVLQEKKVEPVGSDRAVPVDIRVISATNEPLEDLIKAGKFRPDLYYRINVLQIHLPPLRHRRGDLPLLVEHFLKEKQPERAIRISPSVMDLFLRYPWYGNVRELENTVEAALSNCDEETLLPKHLPPQIVETLFPGSPFPSGAGQPHAEAGALLTAFEKFLLLDALKGHGGRVRKAAQSLGMSVRTLERKMKQHGLDRLAFQDAKRVETAWASTLKTFQTERVRWDTLFQHVAEPICIVEIVEKDLRIAAVNPALEALIGMSAQRAMGQPCYTLFQCSDKEGKEACREGACRCAVAIDRQEAIPSLYLTVKTAHRQDLPVWASISPLPDLSGKQTLASVIFRDVSEQKEEEQALRAQAITDSLTGLFNRRYFEESLQREVQRSNRYERPLSLVFCDIDDFKAVNDRYGHPYGDTVLQAIAGLLEKNTRSSDLVCRYGGEEFALLLPETGKAGALVAAEKLRKVVERAPIGDGESSVGLTLSFGVAAFPEDAKTEQELVQRADEALYRAKREGKNRVCVHEGSP
ncbi:MAG: sigma 54-interacting transcriptional regulator [Nitrospirae bacterium]|nr:sigma 54-interacting transcriptional regulator [Nitrospirota bacterium]